MSRTVLAACLTALVLRLAVGLVCPVGPTWDGKVYERAATQLAHGEGYTHRMIRPDGPAHATSFYPVGWPATLGAWRAAGMPRGLDPLLQAILGTLAVALAAIVAREMAGDRAGSITAWTVALWPSGIVSASSWMGEPLFTLALLAAIAPLAQVRWRLVGMIASAILFGLAAYVRPTALAIAPLAIAAYAYAAVDRRRILAAIGGAILGAAIAIAVVSPWIARNVDRLGQPVMTSNGGANLLVGTASPTFVRIPADIDCPPSYELPRDACRRARAIERIERDPLAWAALAPQKLFHTFGYEASAALHFGASVGVARPERHPLVWALGALSTLYWLALVFFVVRGAREVSSPARLALVAPALALALVHVVFLGGDRYHEPLVPLFAALASPALVRVASKVALRFPTPLRSAR